MSKKSNRTGNTKAINLYPKTPAFFALGIFVFLMVMLSVGTVRWMDLGGFAWYKLVLLLSFVLLTIMMLVRIMFAYKKVTFKTMSVTESYPLRIGAKETINLSKYILFWEVTKKKVGKQEFDVLSIYTKISTPIVVSDREMTNFKSAVKFMEVKFPKFHRSKVK
ncbi:MULTISPECIES: hypothetical protein [Flammeovirga]|uniref:Uncharacterized protein n=1 Tax=Flammeovirga agarivorans TaxID=2726742 RepID=A0A7X8SI27_9BACT|nr:MULTISPECIES: hypothetical protein [Flammeovirga]NLR90626.1 hypothetical protein [Flammeovirga agarivorans]